jgi:hypothetical protein
MKALRLELQELNGQVYTPARGRGVGERMAYHRASDGLGRRAGQPACSAVDAVGTGIAVLKRAEWPPSPVTGNASPSPRSCCITVGKVTSRLRY